MVTEHKADLWVVLRTASILHSVKPQILHFPMTRDFGRFQLRLNFCSFSQMIYINLGHHYYY